MTEFTNSGILFRNDRKEQEKQPDYTGKLDKIDCQHCGKSNDYELSAWIKQGQRGKFMSLRVKEPYVKPQRDPNRAGLAERKPEPDFDGDLPF